MLSLWDCVQNKLIFNNLFSDIHHLYQKSEIATSHSMHTPESGDGLFEDLSVYEKEARVTGQKHSSCPSGRKKTHTTKRQHSTRRSSWKKSCKGDCLEDSQGDEDLPVESFLSYIEIKEGKHLL